jgi:hypothetical protein
MAEKLKPPKKGDEVYIKRWDAYGRVLISSNEADTEEDQHYKVQILHSFRPNELELYEAGGEREERDRMLALKMSRFEKAKIAAEHDIATNNLRLETLKEFWAAYNEVQKELES